MKKMIINECPYFYEADRTHKVFAIAILISLFLNIPLFIALETSLGSGIFVPSDKLREKVVVFNLVEERPVEKVPFLDTPDKISEESPEKPVAISDKSSKTSDLKKSAGEITPTPFSKGKSDFMGKTRDITNVIARAEAVPLARPVKQKREFISNTKRRVKAAAVKGLIDFPARKEIPEHVEEQKKPEEKEKVDKKARDVSLVTSSISIPRLSKRLEDRIDEALSDTSSNAEIFDEIEYNVKSDIIGPYVKTVKNKILNLWYYYLYKDKMPFIYGNTLVVFKIMPNGTLSDINLARHTGGGSLDARYGLLAVDKAAPFSEMGSDVVGALKSDGLWIAFEFSYR